MRGINIPAAIRGVSQACRAELARLLFKQEQPSKLGSTQSKAAARGFTLLEMVVVLAILGLATAMVAPSMLRSIDTWRRQSQLDAVLDQVRGLPARARAQGLAIEISDTTLQGDKPPLQAGDGWQLHAPEPWQVQANGVCEGGRLQLDSNGRERVLQVGAPFCEPRIEGEN